MWRTLIILTILSICSFVTGIASYLPPQPTPDPNIFQAASPSGRYTVRLTTFASPYDFAFSAFSIYDTHTGRTNQQRLSDVPIPYGTPSGLTFDWTPSERYLWITTDELASSHGCDELFVYTGDGSRLVFDSATTTSLCHSIETDASIEIIAVCPNDDILFEQSGIFRLMPSSGTYTPLPSLADAKC